MKDLLPFSWHQRRALSLYHWQLQRSFLTSCHLGPAFHAHWVVMFISLKQFPESVLLLAWLLWLCVFLFSSLFIQCLWMLNKPLWALRISSFPEHPHPLWNYKWPNCLSSSFQSGIVGTRCFPGSITIVFLFGGVFAVSLKGKMSFKHGNCLGLFQRLGKTNLRKIWRLPSLLLLLVLWAGGGIVSWTPVHPFVRTLSCDLTWPSQSRASLAVFSELLIFRVLGTVCSFAIQRSGIKVHIHICLSTCCFCFHLLLHSLLDSQLQINSILFMLKWNTIIWQLAYSTMLEVPQKSRTQASQPMLQN